MLSNGSENAQKYEKNSKILTMRIFKKVTASYKLHFSGIFFEKHHKDLKNNNNKSWLHSMHIPKTL